MYKREKEVIQAELESEKDMLKRLERYYAQASRDIAEKSQLLQTQIDAIQQAGASDEVTLSLARSKVYQKQYQDALKEQIDAILEKLHSDEYTSIEQYLQDCYTNGYVGTMYSMAGQGVPIISPIDQAAVVRAVQLESKIKEDLYTDLGVDTKAMKKAIKAEVSRGIASGLSYNDMARNLNNAMGTGLSNARRIVRTEGHRIQEASADDAREVAKSKGADVFKQWDATLDGETRPTHRELDGKIVETNDLFKVHGKSARYPGDFGDPAEDCNCRCKALTRSRSALDEEELEELKARAEFFGLDKTADFEDYKKKFLKASKTIENSDNSGIMNTKQVNSKIKDGVTVVNPMDEAKYSRLKAGLEKRGIHVIQATGDDLKYLQILGAEASYGNGYIMHIGPIPSASGMYEEIIHSTQARIYGEFADSDPLELYAREIAANRMLLKNGKAYGFDETDFEDIERNLSGWENRFKKLLGVSYDESDYSREI